MVWLKRLGIIVFSLLLVVTVVGALRAPVWTVEVAQDIAAPVSAIHEELVDFRRWKTWAGWDADVDPDAEYTYTGKTRGQGSAWSWKGPVMGQGRMMMTKADPAQGVWFDEAIESDEFNARGSITHTDLGDGTTRVVWRDEGRLPSIIGGLVSPFVVSALEKHFAAALVRLKERVETRELRYARLPQTQVHGSVHALISERDWSTKVDLSELSIVRTIGVGMLKDLRGYVTFVEGGAWLAEAMDGRIADRVTAEPTGEAAMMVVAKVDRWRASAISKEVPFDQIGAQISARISQVGLPTDRPIPFRLRGDIVNAVWHVVDGDRIDETMKTAAEIKRTGHLQTRSRVKADIVGFYAPKQGGVITEHGQAVRAHIVVPIERVSGHLDSGMIQPMSVLLLPDISE